MKPARLLDRSFVYTPSWQTDIRERFARVRAESAAAQARERAGIEPQVVTPLRKENRK